MNNALLLMSNVALCMAAIAVPSTLSSSEALDPSPSRVALNELYAHAEDYDGKEVVVVGFLADRFEIHALFDDKDSYRYFITERAAWLVLSDQLRAVAKRHHGQVVTVTGVVDASHRGHMGLYPLAIRAESLNGRSVRNRK